MKRWLLVSLVFALGCSDSGGAPPPVNGPDPDISYELVNAATGLALAVETNGKCKLAESSPPPVPQQNWRFAANQITSDSPFLTAANALSAREGGCAASGGTAEPSWRLVNNGTCTDGDGCPTYGMREGDRALAVVDEGLQATAIADEDAQKWTLREVPGGARWNVDGNDDIDGAIDLTDQPTLGARFEFRADLDFYTFEGERGEAAIVVASGESGSTNDSDTVITLYDPSMTQIAQNDDAVPRINTDSELITVLPEAGTYTVVVEQFGNWNTTGEGGDPGAGLTYTVKVGSINSSADTVNVDQELGDGPANTQILQAAENGFGLIVGDFYGRDDVDRFAVTMPEAFNSASFVLMPSGVDGHGSTTTATVSVRTDSLTVAGGDHGVSSLNVPMPDAEYVLKVEHGGDAGDNDFYIIKVFMAEDNPYEGDSEANDTFEGAEAREYEPRDDGRSQAAFVVGTLTDGDVDHYLLPVEGPSQALVACEARVAGSGVLGLTADLLAPSGAVLASATETDEEKLNLEHDVTEAGSYVVRLSKQGQDPEVDGQWLRCGFHVMPPGGEP